MIHYELSLNACNDFVSATHHTHSTICNLQTVLASLILLSWYMCASMHSTAHGINKSSRDSLSCYENYTPVALLILKVTIFQV
jgi:hypothetical protein